jgi:type III restriction enzyme
MIHNAVIRARQEKNTPNELFNTNTLEKIIEAFETKFTETYNQKFTYQPLDYTAQTSLFKDGDFVAELNQTYLGLNVAKDVKYDKTKYLYDKVVYDSDIEYDVLKSALPKQVTVYGKLPKKSIKLPTYTGGTTSPDFVYTVREEKPEQVNIHLIVETKSDNPRNSDKIAVATQQKFFELLKKENSCINIEWRMVTNVADFQRELENLSGKKA